VGSVVSHEDIRQAAPETRTDWIKFPHKLLLGALYRVCRKGLGAGWFSSDGGGRFDLQPPQGTCYLSTDWPPAVLEVLGVEVRDGILCEDFFADRQLAIVNVRDCRLADTTHAQAAAYGVTSQLSTMTPYDIPQAWANFFHSAGWPGMLYRLRFDPTAPPVGVAMFGDAGAQDLDVLRDETFGETHFRVLWQAYGIKVLPRPELADLMIAD
jgi:hypothetical protein